MKKLVRKQGGQREVTIYVDGLFEHHRIVQGDTIQENNSLHVLDNQSRIAIIAEGYGHPDDTGPAVNTMEIILAAAVSLIVSESPHLDQSRRILSYGKPVRQFSLKPDIGFRRKERDEEAGCIITALRTIHGL